MIIDNVGLEKQINIFIREKIQRNATGKKIKSDKKR
jgi:hypothetical protein